MQKKVTYSGLLLGLLFLLSGCMNPGSAATQGHTAYSADIEAVKSAVLAYKKDNGVFPIKNSDESTPVYTKYQIDFRRLKGEYISQPPSNAYSEGGYFDYIILNPETSPEVKVVDLTLINTVQEIQQKVDNYRMQKGYAPLGGVISAKRYKINFKDLGYKEPPSVISPYSGKELGFIMDNNAKVYINYLPDLYDAVKKQNLHAEAGDIRHLLTDQSLYAPVDSLPYTIKNDQIVFLVK